ncbi:MAG: hypothetical protein AAFO04_18440 [Cyanobacteria bacterium J06592_8]
MIQLPAGLGFESLELTAQADDRVLITLATTQEQLVILEGITPSEITETDIITSFERSETIDDLAVSLSTLVPSRETLEFVQGLEA